MSITAVKFCDFCKATTKKTKISERKKDLFPQPPKKRKKNSCYAAIEMQNCAFDV